MVMDLIYNGDFERGLSGWMTSGSVEEGEEGTVCFAHLLGARARIWQRTFPGYPYRWMPRLVLQARNVATLNIEITLRNGTVRPTTVQVVSQDWSPICAPQVGDSLDTGKAVIGVSISVEQCGRAGVDITEVVLAGESALRSGFHVPDFDLEQALRPPLEGPGREWPLRYLWTNPLVPILEMQEGLAMMLEHHVARLDDSIRSIRESLEGKGRSIPAGSTSAKAARIRRR